MSQANQQLELDSVTKELLAINTHKGLYQPNRLQFGVHSATGIFQRVMDKRIGDRPHVKLRIDDILLSGKDDNEHLENLDRVCSESGITLKLSKSSFFQSQMTCCGYVISKEGIRPMPRNVEAVMAAPSPGNVTELRAFLGMVNYYPI